MPLPTALKFLDETHVRHGGRACLYFAGSNYLRLASHPAWRNALAVDATTGPLHPGASRATTGQHPAYNELEKTVARFFRQESAVFVSAGYLAPIAACQALRDQITHVVLDDWTHSSVADGAVLTRRPLLRFPQMNVVALARILRKLPKNSRPLVATNGLYGSKGLLAPLDEYLAALPRRGWLLVDDAHGAGAVGPQGRGTVASFHLDDRRIVQTISFSKSFGVMGGAVLGTRAIREAVVSRAAAFIGNTSPPLPLVRAVQASVKLVQASLARVRRLQSNARLLYEHLPHLEEIIADPRSPVMTVTPSSTGRGARLRSALLRARIFPPWIRYLDGPASGFFRFSVSSAHTAEQIRLLSKVISATLT